MKMSHVQASGMQVNADDYESKYKEAWKPGETLETIYERFNIHRPEDFTGHSLSVSDVVVYYSYTDLQYLGRVVMSDGVIYPLSHDMKTGEVKEERN